jgi:hypothetical protein
MKIRNPNHEIREAFMTCAVVGDLEAPLPLTPALSFGESIPRTKMLRFQPLNPATPLPSLSSPSGAGGFMGSLDLQNWTRIGTMNRSCRSAKLQLRANVFHHAELELRAPIRFMVRAIIALSLALFAELPLLAATNSESENEILKLSPPQAELPPSFWEQHGTWLGLTAVLLLVLVGAAVWWMLRPKPSVPVLIEILSRKELEALRQRSEDGRVLSQISRVLRRYLAGAFALPADELTTSEFCRVIASHEKVGPELAAEVSDFLRRCDELKFAPADSPTPIGAATRALELVELGEARRTHLRKLEVEAAVPPATRT